MSAIRIARRIAPGALLILGVGLLALGLSSRPRVPTYVNRHPWVDYITSGAIMITGGIFIVVRRVLLNRDMPTSTVVIAAVALAIGVAWVIGSVVFAPAG